MNLSYWEKKTWINDIDFTIIGSGIVGLNCGLSLRAKYPNSKIVIVERAALPQGASTKNAGFACFGSVSEILNDLESASEERVFELVKKRWEGLLMLRELIGDKSLDYQTYGGYEIFQEKDTALYEKCLEKRSYLNTLLKPLFKQEVYSLVQNNIFKLGNVKEHYILNRFEGQLDAGKMTLALIKKCIRENILFLNGVEIDSFTDIDKGVVLKAGNLEMNSRKLCIATNGFAKKLITENVQPARAQVLITKPIKNLHIKGTFHLDEGYYYFRNIDNRILLGGGRNLDKEGETTFDFGKTTTIQNALKDMLKTVVLPETSFEIEQGWSGIMGVSDSKIPIVKTISENVYCGVRLGGMGVAIGTTVGRDLAALVN